MNQVTFKQIYAERMATVKELIAKTNKSSVLIIQQISVDKDDNLMLPNVRESISNIICFVEIGDTEMVEFILTNIKDIIDRVILDVDIKRDNSNEIIDAVTRLSTIPIFNYSDLDMWGNASIDFILRIERTFTNKRILLVGHSFLTTRLLLNLLNRNCQIYMFSDDFNQGNFDINKLDSIEIQTEKINMATSDIEYDILIGSSIMQLYDSVRLDQLKIASVYDIGLHNFSKEFIQSCVGEGKPCYRFDNRAGISSVVLNLMETDYLIAHNLGQVHIGNIKVVSGGMMGEEGVIVVDNAYNPQMILGVANGEGRFKQNLTQQDLDNMTIINTLIES